jgi:putative flippase GtrA
VRAHLPQVLAFAGVGVVAAAVHFGLLIGLVELAGWAAVPATLMGYVGGGLVSYGLNRRHTYRSDRPHGEAGWRFAVVAGVGFGLTWLSMALLHGRLGLQYVLAQVLTTGLVLVWSFLAHKVWTFGKS